MQDDIADGTKKQPDSSLKQEFLRHVMGEVRPVYSFWNQNVADSKTLGLLNAKTLLAKHKKIVFSRERVVRFSKNRGFLSDTS